MDADRIRSPYRLKEKFDDMGAECQGLILMPGRPEVSDRWDVMATEWDEYVKS